MDARHDGVVTSLSPYSQPDRFARCKIDRFVAIARRWEDLADVNISRSVLSF